MHQRFDLCQSIAPTIQPTRATGEGKQPGDTVFPGFGSGPPAPATLLRKIFVLFYDYCEAVRLRTLLTWYVLVLC